MDEPILPRRSLRVLGSEFVTSGAAATARAALRFPLALAAGVAGAAAGSTYAAHDIFWPGRQRCLALTLASWLGVSLFIATRLLVEARAPSSLRGRLAAKGADLFAGLLIVGAYFKLQRLDEFDLTTTVAIWAVGTHALVVSMPLAARRPVDLRTFGLRLLRTAARALLFTNVLAGGLIAALGLVAELFHVPVPSWVFLGAWLFMLGIFNTVLVLTGIPRVWTDAEAEPAPKLMRALTRRLLVPLGVLFLGIAYVYAAWILLAWRWPRGFVAAPILGVAAFVLVTALLDEPDHPRSWDGWHLRRAFALLLPLSVLVLFATVRRIVDYGFTDERCLVLAAAVHLFVNAVYFLVSRRRHLGFMPASVVAAAILMSFEPFSVGEISARSQLARLERQLERAGRLAAGAFVPADAPVGDDEGERIGAIVRHLRARGRDQAVLGWVTAAKDCPPCERWRREGRDPNGDEVIELLAGRTSVPKTQVFLADATGPKALPRHDVEIAALACETAGGGDELCTLGGPAAPALRPLAVAFGAPLNALGARLDVKWAGSVIVSVPLEALATELSARGEGGWYQHMPAAALTVAGGSVGGVYRLEIARLVLSVAAHEPRPRIKSVSGRLLLSAPALAGAR